MKIKIVTCKNGGFYVGDIFDVESIYELDDNQGYVIEITRNNEWTSYKPIKDKLKLISTDHRRVGNMFIYKETKYYYEGSSGATVEFITE